MRAAGLRMRARIGAAGTGAEPPLISLPPPGWSPAPPRNAARTHRGRSQLRRRWERKRSHAGRCHGAALPSEAAVPAAVGRGRAAAAGRDPRGRRCAAGSSSITRGGTGLGLGPSGAALRGLRGARDGGRGVRGITVGPSRPLPPSPAGSRRSAASNGGARGSHMEPRGRSADNEALWGWGAAGRRSALLLTRLGVGELCCYGLNLIC